MELLDDLGIPFLFLPVSHLIIALVQVEPFIEIFGGRKNFWQQEI